MKMTKIKYILFLITMILISNMAKADNDCNYVKNKCESIGNSYEYVRCLEVYVECKRTDNINNLIEKNNVTAFVRN